MKKKKYETPAAEVVELNHQQHLLAGSDGQVGVQDYEHWYDVPEE